MQIIESVVDLIQQENILKVDQPFDERYVSRMEKFERKILGKDKDKDNGKDNGKKHYRSRTKFDTNEYLEFTHNSTYASFNEELRKINFRKIQMISELYKLFPTGDKHAWVEEDDLFVVKMRKEYLLDD
jgi:hypothetical protein